MTSEEYKSIKIGSVVKWEHGDSMVMAIITDIIQSSVMGITLLSSSKHKVGWFECGDKVEFMMNMSCPDLEFVYDNR